MASNEFFDNATKSAFPKGSKARAEAVDAKFDSVTAGFDKLQTPNQQNAGTRNFILAAGAANAYTLAISHITSYTDGLEVQFRIDTGDDNTGASTLDVNSVGAVGLVYPDNTALVADDLPAGAVVSARYSSALSKFVMQSVTQGNVNAAATSAAAAAADLALTNADVVTTGEKVGYANEWAVKVEDSLVSAAAGGNQTTDYSALHHAAKAAASSDEIVNGCTPYASATPDIYLNFTEGTFFTIDGSTVTIADGAQVTPKGGVWGGGFTSISTIYIDEDGALAVQLGTPSAGTPVPPVIPYNAIPICYIDEGESDTIVYTADITDVRSYRNTNSVKDVADLGVSASAAELSRKEFTIDLVLGTADDKYLVMPFACDLKNVYSVVDGALATGNEVINFYDNSDTVMTGTLTILSTAVAGEVDSVAVSGDNSFTAGQRIKIHTDGGNSNAVVATLTFVALMT